MLNALGSRILAGHPAGDGERGRDRGEAADGNYSQPDGGGVREPALQAFALKILLYWRRTRTTIFKGAYWIEPGLRGFGYRPLIMP